MKKHLIILCLLGLFCIGCQNGKKPKEKSSSTTEQVAQNQYNIQLNDGRPWKANPETNDGIEKMSVILTRHATETQADFKQIGKLLKEVQTYIIRQCTMKGEAHKNLHKWLTPLVKNIEALQNSKSLSASKKYYTQIQQQLKDYHKFFQ